MADEPASPSPAPEKSSPSSAAPLGASVIPIVNKLQDIFVQLGSQSTIELPQVAVVGSQSSGKSSVLEALVGRDFLPRGNEICTRRPLVLQLLQIKRKPEGDGADEEWGEFLHLPGQRFYNFADIRREIQAETAKEAGDNKGVSDKQIRLKIFSPNVLDITLVDLPGITKVPVGDQPSDIEARIRTMILSYIKKPSCLILAVSAANSDLANSDALQIAGNADPDGHRTIGVITKLDIMDRGTDARNLLLGKVIHLKLGYVGVVNRSQEDIMFNRSIKDALVAEEKFFRSHPVYNGLADRCGVPQLAKKLNQILVQHIKALLPGLKSRISTALVSVAKEVASYGEITESKAGKGALLLNILSKYCEAFSSMVEGKNEEMSTAELSGGARIHYIFQSIFVKSLEEVDPCENLTDDDIRTAIQNATGPKSALFVPEVPFDVLVRRQIARLLDPSQQCARFIYDELVKISHRCLVNELQRFPALRKSMDGVISDFLRDGLAPAETMIAHIIGMEMDYLNTSHPNFIGGSKAVEIALQQMRSSRLPIPIARQKDGVENDKIQSSSDKTVKSRAITARQVNGISPDQGVRSVTDGERLTSGNTVGSSWGIPSLFGGVDNSRTAAKENVASKFQTEVAHNVEALDHSFSMIHLREPPSVLRPSENHSEQETIEIAVTKLLLKSYYDIVRKNVEDLVPKAIMHFLEPLMEVFAPGSKNLQAYMLNRLVVHVCREFREAEKRGVVPWVRVDELTTLFPNLSETIVRKRLKECAVLRRDAKGHLHWSKKRDFTIPSEEDLKKLVTPENVCAYESMQAGMYRLKHLGITRLTLPAGVSAATSQLPDEAIALAAASHIERELQITPWSLSGNFVACLNQDRENIERLEITGVGDPSGRGLGFSYVRATPKAPAPNALTKKKAAAGRGGTTVTGTDADLRRLSMEAAREVLAKFNVPDEQIAKLTRWHRIAMIRKLSSEQAASGVKVDPTTISKYARGQRMSFLQLQQQTREKCQEIWDRQVQSLSAFDADYNQSDTEENSDLDSFAGDLENLLDAEEFEDVDNYESKHEKLDGVKGLKMRRRPLQTQAEEEIEDEAAEAAELCRLLVDDDLTEQKKKKKPKASVAVNTVPPVTKLNSVLNTENVKKPKKFQSNGSFTPKEDIMGAFKEGEMMFVKKNLSEKKKPMLKNNSSNLTPVTPRIKIVAETSKSQIFKEKKSARESFVCGACGQLGHMKTNKHCPKYREGSEALVEVADFEKASGKTTSTDMPSQSQQKTGKKRTMIKRATNAEPSESEKSIMKAKVIPVKIKCGSTEKFVDKPADGSTKSMEPPSTSDVQAIESDLEIASKAKKIKVSTKAKADDVQVEARRHSLVIRSPAETEKSQAESQKAPLVTLPSTTVGNDRVLSRKPSIVIRPPAEKERELAHKKVVFKRSKEVIDLDQVSLDGDLGFEYRKTKKIVELASFDEHGMREKNHFMGDSTKKKAREDRRWSGDERKRRTNDRMQEDMSRNFYRDGIGMFEEQDRVDLRRYEEGDWREEELRPKKNKKKKRPESIDVYSEDSGGRGRSDKRIPERVRGVKRRPAVESGRYVAEHASATKRRRGGEVGLANILERIVDALKANGSVSYLFHFPVPKKIAPDYYDIIKEPMDLSTIRGKVRNMEYKNREEFRHDVCQITINAHKYNDRRNPDIPPLADQLLELCDFMLNEHDESLTEAEERIEPLD